MNLPHDQFCVLPWISLETSPIGTVRPCCLAEEEIVDNAGVKFDLNSAEFRDIQNSRYMQALRQQFLDKKQPATCRRCWSEEASNRTSKRMHTLDRLKHVIADGDWTADARPLLFLDLKLGNICNLKCRICGSWSSSTYATEELKFVKDKKASWHYTMLQQGAWPRKNRQFWSEISQVTDDIRYIEFTGGEPFMINEHFDLLEQLVDSGHAGNIEIHYNTNGTVFPARGPDIWSHFRLVEVAFSIDDVDQRFEYQRSGAQWTAVQNTINEFSTLQRQRQNLRLQICATVNALNVYYLPELAEWIQAQPVDFVYWNMLHDAPEFNIANLSVRAKTAAAERLLTAAVTADTRREFERIVEFMRQGPVKDNNDKLKTIISTVDFRREENLKTVALEWAEVLFGE